MKITIFTTHTLLLLATTGCIQNDKQHVAILEITMAHQDPRQHIETLISDKSGACRTLTKISSPHYSCEEIIGGYLFDWGGFKEAKAFIETPPTLLTNDKDGLRLRLNLLGYMVSADSPAPILTKIKNNDLILPPDVSLLFRPDTFDTMACLAIANMRIKNKHNAEVIRDTAAIGLLTMSGYKDWVSCERNIKRLRVDYIIDFAVVLEAAEKVEVQSKVLGVGSITSQCLWDIFDSQKDLTPQLLAYAKAMRNELQK